MSSPETDPNDDTSPPVTVTDHNGVAVVAMDDGKANAIGQALASLSRAVFPTLAGGIWAVTMRLGAPWQPHGVYVMLLALNLAAVHNARRLPLDFNTPRAELRAQKS